MRISGSHLSEIHTETHLYNSINSYTTHFRNALYKGELHYGDQVFPNYCAPIVDAETWDKVQAINQASKEIRSQKGVDSPDHPRRQASPYLLSGLAHCVRCGALLVGGSCHSAKEKNRRYYYQCGNANRTRTCDLRKIPKEILEDAVLATLADYILDPDVITAQQKLIDAAATHPEIDPEIRKALTTRHAALKRRIANVVEALADAGKSQALLDKLADLETQEAELRGSLEEMDRARSEQRDRSISLADIQAMAAIVKEHFKNFDLLTQKKILKGLISRISVDRVGRLISGLVEYFQPPDDLLTDTGDAGGDPSKKYRYNLCPHRESRYTYTFSKNFEIIITRNNP
jgi:hypothetical protein